ncbi:ribosomal protein S18 acetylase RimI-like enzyme [Halohasta litchfieldiae]|jgi:ribosomal protein S18 acetylase RimI-like enzyme|uniref:Ribosomal protein S18 acetylase RimI n=1 Tax=Halohasta litchfieldiae TaxID=1073996 RepID=A0A1H6V9H7_9EURY|nr:N-acetyltransferase [Halohasta litchfieldiae]ATW87561.1 ribosomal protein S18 acetylase RimI-like enzyme [Halohasta litchfieldiae]SEI96925.1 Ribosomal protein S18 acetylase RimI [Halohasta litchfieldiae]
MTPQPPIRPARSDDGAVLQQLQSLLSEPSPGLLSTALAERSTASIGSASALQTSTLLISPDSTDQPVGYLLAVGGESTHIAELAVDPDHRRENRATALLQEICTNATEPVTVHVAADNEPALSLYRRVGFVEQGRSSELFERSDGLTLVYDPSTKVD